MIHSISASAVRLQAPAACRGDFATAVRRQLPHRAHNRKTEHGPSGESLGNDGTASGRSSVQLAASRTPTFAWPASVSADNRRFLDQKGNVYLLKTMSSWAMAQNCTNAEITRALEGLKAARFQCRDRLAVRGPHERQLWRQVQEQGRPTLLYRCTVCFIVRPCVVFDGLDHVRSHQAPIDRGVFIVHELGQYRDRSGSGQRWDDECLQFWKSSGDPLCRLSEHRLACDG